MRAAPRQFGEYSLDLEVFAYVDTTDYGEFLEIAEDVNLRIMDVIKAAGTELAIPAQNLYEKGQGAASGNLDSLDPL